MIDRGKHTKNLIALLSVTRDLGQAYPPICVGVRMKVSA